MARYVPREVELLEFVRGDYWNGAIVYFNREGFDFTGVTAALKIRQRPDGPVITTITPIVTVIALGRLEVTFTVAGTVTKDFPIGTVFGDIELSRNDPAFGPKTWCRFRVTVIGDVTHA